MVVGEHRFCAFCTYPTATHATELSGTLNEITTRLLDLWETAGLADILHLKIMTRTVACSPIVPTELLKTPSPHMPHRLGYRMNSPEEFKIKTMIY